MLSFQPKAQGPHSASTARCPLRARTGATGNRDSQGPWAQWASLRANPGPSLHKSTHLPIPPPLPVPTTTFPSCTGQQSPADLCLLPTPHPPPPLPAASLPPSLLVLVLQDTQRLLSGKWVWRLQEGGLEGERETDQRTKPSPVPPVARSSQGIFLRQKSKPLLSCLNPFRSPTGPTGAGAHLASPPKRKL